MKYTFIATTMAIIACACICYGIVRYEIEKNSVTTYPSICGNVYEMKKLTLGKVLWEGRYIFEPFMRFHLYLRGLEVGSSSAACEQSEILLSKRING